MGKNQNGKSREDYVIKVPQGTVVTDLDTNLILADLKDKDSRATICEGGRGENEWQNIKLLHKVIELTAAETGKSVEDVEKTITYVKDRPGHDKRYAIDCTKIKNELGWQRKMTFEQGLLATVKWYLNNPEYVTVPASVATMAEP